MPTTETEYDGRQVRRHDTSAALAFSGVQPSNAGRDLFPQLSENAEEVMDDFPAFMKSKWTRVPASQQNTKDVEGHYCEANDGSQVAFWTCHSEQVSVEHRHAFDEYMVCVSGQYTAHVENQTFVLNPGDELLIPKGKLQWGQAKPGTRSIHVFGGQRIKGVTGAGSNCGSLSK